MIENPFAPFSSPKQMDLYYSKSNQNQTSLLLQVPLKSKREKFVYRNHPDSSPSREGHGHPRTRSFIFFGFRISIASSKELENSISPRMITLTKIAELTEKFSSFPGLLRSLDRSFVFRFNQGIDNQNTSHNRIFRIWAIFYCFSFKNQNPSCRLSNTNNRSSGL